MLTFSACSSDDSSGDDGVDASQRYMYCVYHVTQQCVVGPVTAAECPGGILSNETPCPYLNRSSSSSSRPAISSSSSGVYGSLPYGGKTYKTIKIDGRTWMAENLNYNSGSSASGSKCYNDDEDLCDVYGRLYDWSTAMGLGSGCNGSLCVGLEQHRGICPSGWHIPSKAEWDALKDVAGGDVVAGKSLKAKEHWNKFNGVSGNGTDNRNFTALPGGYYVGAFDGIDEEGYWWSTEENSRESGKAGSWSMHHKNDSLSYSLKEKSSLFSVRCIQD